MTDPATIDFAWLAHDAADHVAVFTSGGAGPLPRAVRERLDDLRQAEGWIEQLPVVGGCDLLVAYPQPEDFIAFATRGLFAYDWQDVHRPLAAHTNQYHPIARPQRPLMLEDLPENLAAVARLVRFDQIEFASAGAIAVE